MTLLERLKREFSFVKGNYAIIVISWILIDFASELPATYYSLYVLKLGATETILGLIALSGFLALASMQFPGGYLADKFGRKWLVSTMTFGVGLSFILYALAPSWPFILLGVVLMSFINSIYQPALMAIVSDSLPPENRGMGFSIIMLITSTSTTPGPLVALVLHDWFGLVQGMRIAYGIVVGLFLIAGLLRLKLKETFVSCGRPRLSELLRSYPTALKESFGVWGKLSRSMFYLFVSSATTMTGIAAVQLFFSVYAIKVLQVGEDIWPLVLTALPITSILLAIPIGKVVDKINRKIPIMFAYACFGAALLLFMAGDVVKLFVSLVLFGAGMVMMNAASSALQADLTPKEHRGKVVGFMSFMNYILMAIGSFLGGFLYEHVSPQMPFLFAFALTIPSLVMVSALVHEPQKREE